MIDQQKLNANYRLSDLVIGHMGGSLSESEKIELNLILLDPQKKKLFDELMDPERTREALKIMSEGDVEGSWRVIQESYFRPRERKRRRKRILIALVIIVGSIIIYYLLSKLTT